MDHQQQAVVEAQHDALAQAFNRLKALALSTVLIGGTAVRHTKRLSSRSRLMRWPPAKACRRST